MCQNIRHFFGKRYNAVILLSYEFFLLIKHLGSSNREKSQEKFKASLIIDCHVIEKGLSFRNVKTGFGKTKILDLLKNLEKYYTKYGDKLMLAFILKPVEQYIKFHKDISQVDNEIIRMFNDLNNILDGEFNKINGGIIHVTKTQIKHAAMIDFENFTAMRFSIRDFSNEPIDRNLIFKALKIAEKTPSACNRQPWGVHVFFDKSKLMEILEFQSGARQFKDSITCALLVTSNYYSFFGGEYHQPFVNGGLYAMTLIYALHSLGLGTIPLNMGFSYSKLNKIYKICNLRPGEIPVILIGVGHLPIELNVALSERFDYTSYTKIY